MQHIAGSFAKLAGVQKYFKTTLEEGVPGARPITNFSADACGQYFATAAAEIQKLREALPALYADMRAFSIDPIVDMSPASDGQPTAKRYHRQQLEHLVRDIEYVFEVRAHSQLASPVLDKVTEPRVFISHGKASDWYAVQAFIERDIGVKTLELAQEPNLGRTILTKLVESSDKCDCAVIVMTGDDLDGEGQLRARENVMHEIGFFQGKYSPNRIILLHEEDVNIPSNIHGVVYTPFSKGNVAATFGLLMRELKAMYPSQ